MRNPFKKKEEVLDPYTIEQCNSCSKISKRKFKEGDYVFKTMDKCISCGNGQIMISKIFGEAVN
jgi:hypothetical protein